MRKLFRAKTAPARDDEEARRVAHERRKQGRPPASSIEMATREIRRGNWRPRV